MTDRQDLIKQLTKAQEEQDITQSSLAKKLNISPTALNQYLQNIYKGDNIKVDDSVRKFLVLHEKKSRHNMPTLGFVETSVAKRVLKIAQSCQIDCEIGLCYGSSGLGKTTAIKQYAKNSSGVIVIDCEAKMTPHLLLLTLNKALGLGTEKYWDPQYMKEQIQKKLDNSGWLIIIDEAEWLNEDSFTILRKFHDKSQETFGLLFVGTHKLYNYLQKNKEQLLYILNRIGYVCALEELKNSDIKAIVESMIPDNTNIWEEFARKANGNTRILAKVLKKALKLSHDTNITVNSDFVAESRGSMLV